MPLNQDPKTVQANTPQGTTPKWVSSSLIPQRTSEFGLKAWTDIDVFSSQVPIIPIESKKDKEYADQIMEGMNTIKTFEFGIKPKEKEYDKSPGSLSYGRSNMWGQSFYK